MNSENEKEGPADGEKAVKPEWGCWSEGRPHPQGPSGSSPKLIAPHDTSCSYWNKEARDRWLGPENIGQTLIDGETVTALIDSGAQVNIVMPSFIKKHGLVVGSNDDLNNHCGRI